VHWVRPEVVAEVIYLTWTEDTCCERCSEKTSRPGRSFSLRKSPEGTPFGTYLERCHVVHHHFQPLSVDHLHRLKRRRQRGLAVEHAFIVLLIASSAFQFLFVVGATVG
jgi:hypothetical protein